MRVALAIASHQIAGGLSIQTEIAGEQNVPPQGQGVQHGQGVHRVPALMCEAAAAPVPKYHFDTAPPCKYFRELSASVIRNPQSRCRRIFAMPRMQMRVAGS